MSTTAQEMTTAAEGNLLIPSRVCQNYRTCIQQSNIAFHITASKALRSALKRFLRFVPFRLGPKALPKILTEAKRILETTSLEF